MVGEGASSAVEAPEPKRRRKTQVEVSAPSSSTGNDAKASRPKRKAQAEPEVDAVDPKQRTIEDMPAVIRRPRVRKQTPEGCTPPQPASADPAATENPSTNLDGAEDPNPTPKSGERTAATSGNSSEAKRRNARKSAAYRRAAKAAKDQGLTPDECAAAGRKVF